MKMILMPLLAFTILACENQTFHSLSPTTEQDHVIYGQDTRQDLTQLSVQAQATGLLVKRQLLKNDRSGNFIFPPITLGQSYPLCETENFRDQQIVGFCSGVLIGPRTLLTAGHCIRNHTQCADTVLTFGHTYQKSLRGSFKSSEIYSCKQIIKHDERVSQGGADYAIIELDRDVVGIKPVQIASTEKEPRSRDTVHNYSYPLGLPLKWDQGIVLKNESSSNFIEVAIDTFSGSSGSGLFNTDGELIGILSRGSEDFLEDEIHRVQTSGGCLSTNRCDKGICRSEKFFKTNRVDFR